MDSTELDARMRAAEDRWAAKHPKRSTKESLTDAIGRLQQDLDQKTGDFKTRVFTMKSAEKAALEEIENLEALIQELTELRDGPGTG